MDIILDKALINFLNEKFLDYQIRFLNKKVWLFWAPKETTKSLEELTININNQIEGYQIYNTICMPPSNFKDDVEEAIKYMFKIKYTPESFGTK